MGRTFGIVLIILGMALLVWTGFTYTQKEKVIDVGPVEVTADREKTVNWPPYVGGLVLIAGVIVFIGSRKKV